MINSFSTNISYVINSAGITDGFSMCGGDFVEVYNDESQEGKNYSLYGIDSQLRLIENERYINILQVGKCTICTYF